MRWIALLLLGAALAAGEAARPLTVMTWNLLADPGRGAERLPAILDTIAAQDADVIVLQEVAPWLRTALLADPRLRDRRSTLIGGRSEAPGGLFVLSRFPLASRVVLLPSRMDRCALVSDLDVDGRRLRVVAVHLESGLRDGQIRARQLRALRAELEAGDDVLLAGDVNFDGDDPAAAEVPAAFTDVWRALRPGDAGLTYDLGRNPLAQANAFVDEDSRRLDRLYLRSEAWTPTAVAIAGDAPVAMRTPELFPSDHFAVVARLVGR